MKQVALYGDSFGTGSLPKNSDGTYNEGIQYHWSKILEKNFNWSITNFAESGASVFETYKNFIEHNQKFELNIVIVTIPKRYFKPIQFSNRNDVDRIVSLLHLESFVKHNFHNPTFKDLEIIENLKGWYNMIEDSDYDTEMCKLMVEKIIRLRPETILITVSHAFPISDNLPLFDIYKQQCDLLGFDCTKTLTIENTKLISGHFTPEINELVGNYISKRIVTGIWSDWNIPEKFKFTYNKKTYFGV
jgi:hypothetical protein